eukprot:TRINITY_DN4025_c0_g1_i1.p1 TRINITY_DN4025_c0_g1~~TRINITY_DN4025_c0_g1_i1.p1  ORF type:complete len:218 (-),score=84.17 TRINITY_DN4025_c0_g1_i1:96-749(-)
MISSDHLLSESRMRKKLSLDSAVLSDTGQEQRSVKHSHQDKARVRSISFDSAGLVLPRKLVNPCKQAVVVREINRQIKWTNKNGIPVLSSKTELEIAMDRHRRVQEEKEKRKQKLPKNEFQRKLSEISGRLTETEIEEEDGIANLEGQKTHNIYLLELNRRLSPGEVKNGGNVQNNIKSEQIPRPEQVNSKYTTKESILESELERVFNQLRDGQKIR